MDVVVHNGKEYKKAALVAKEFGYTTDYIGQLCRAEKVDARLVGRAWYVNTDSLHVHKKARYKIDFKARVEAVEVSDEPEKQYLKRVIVAPVLKNKTVRITKHFKDGYRELPVRYDSDEESLIPRIVKEARPTSIPVDLAESKKLKIKTPRRRQGEAIILRPEPLPEVVLKGSVSVASVEEESPVTPSKPEVPTTVAAPQPLLAPNAVAETPKTLQKRNSSIRDNHKNKPRIQIRTATDNPAAQNKKAANFTPSAVASRQNRSTKRRKTASKRPRLFGVSLVFLLLILLGLMLPMLQSESLVSEGQILETWSLDFGFYNKLISN